jgi:preprotein translocase subunit SecF
MSMKSLANRLYSGETTIQFVGRRRLWFTISAIACLISVIALIYPGLNLGIDFEGGSVFRAEATKPVTVEQVQTAVGPVAQVVQVTQDTPPQVIVQTEELPQAEVARINAALKQVTGSNEVSTEAVGSKWGATVSRKALIALLVFIAAVAIYVSLRFEPKMAATALIALVHDLLITAGIYALARFEVTPATVIALLTILGYSLYDTVVVFDKVRENTRTLSSLSRTTYSDAANLAVNQTAVRSLNTSLTSLLPVGALLFAGSLLLGAEVLKDLSLALFVGVGAGTYSSMFLAVPLLCAWKEREPRFRDLRARVERREASGARSTRAAAGARATAKATDGAADGAADRAASAKASRRQQQRQQQRRGAAATPFPEAEETLLPSVPPDPDEAYEAEGEGEEVPAAEKPKEPAQAGQRPRSSGHRPQQQRRKGGKQSSGGRRRRR